MNQAEYRYFIDSQNRIIETDFFGDGSKCWNNDSPCHTEGGTSVWDVVEGIETRHLYEALFQKVRSGALIGPIPFRCDSPDERVFFELFMIPHAEGTIEVKSCFVRSESREPIKLLDETVDRSDELLSICSMCKKIKLDDETWVEVERAVEKLKLFELARLPQLTHGLCQSCYQVALKEAGLLD